MIKKKILVTGGDGRFAKVLKIKNKNLDLYFASKKDCNILNIKSISNIVKKVKPDIILHTAGLSRPMKIHEKDINKSISLNIIGTANLVQVCNIFNIKIIYFSSNYVYEGKKGNYKETDAVKPFNNYGLSKLGAECSVAMYKNSLILRICMTEKPFIHKKAFNDVETNFTYHHEVAKNLLKLIDHKGIINVGGPKKIIYNFAKKSNKNVIPMSSKKIIGKQFPKKQTMNISKFLKIIKK